MDIEVGDYVRTRNGEIGIFIEYRNDKFFCKIKIRNTYYTPPISTIVNHSKNLIDLIEVGDLLFINDFAYYNFIHIYDGTMLEALKEDVKNGVKIKQILTHEQYMQNCYTVEREEEIWDKD